MNQPFELSPAKRDQLLREAVGNRVPAVLTCKIADQWVRLTPRLFGVDEQAGHVLLKYATKRGQTLPDIGSEQSVNISFRRGNRKYVFDTIVVEYWETVSEAPGTPGGLRVQWPSALYELQRRLYHRTTVPRGIVIPVDIWNCRPTRKDRGRFAPNRGTMLNVSAGGISLVVPVEQRLPCSSDEPITCRFATEPDGPPVEIPTIHRRRERLPDGRVRIGLQFIGLDATPQGRATIRRIHQMATRFRSREAMRR